MTFCEGNHYKKKSERLENEQDFRCSLPCSTCKGTGRLVLMTIMGSLVVLCNKCLGTGVTR